MKKALTLILLVGFLASCRYSPMQQAWTPKSHKKMPNRNPSAYKK